MDVYLLWHVHELPDGEEDAKLIGVYSTEASALEARGRAISLPGFRDAPDGFQVARYTVGQDEWTEGFITVTHETVSKRFKDDDA
jgi:hypothetical protein